MRITGQWFDVQVTTMRQMTYDVLLGMDILAPLGLTMTLNGTRIFPPSHASKGACATEGPIPMDGLKPEEKRRVGKGLFEFEFMPFGLHAAAPTFQRLLDRVITPDMAPSAFAYLHDIVICTETLEEHMKALEKVFQKL